MHYFATPSPYLPISSSIVREMINFPRIILKSGKEKSLLRGHPWVFSGAVAKIEGEVSPGDIGEVYSHEGHFLSLGHFNPRSQIIVRILTFRREEVGENFFRERVSKAVQLRKELFKGRTNAYRVINGEGDSLPGLIVDRYQETLVLQCLTAGMERIKAIVMESLVKEFHPQALYERSDAATRKEEGLTERRGLLYGKEVPEFIEIEEYGCHFKVNVKKGHKTGFYLDQRENRFLLEGLSEGKKILDCFSYTGAFSIHGGSGNAKEITLVDFSEEALAMAEEHFDLNQLRKIPHRTIRGDVFEVMRNLKGGYDIIILDPPPFAKKKGNLLSASRGYKELNLWALRLLNRKGLLLTFSCSHHMNWDLFQKIVFSSALDSDRTIQLLGRMGHPWDHPIHLSHPEGEYLRGLICRVE